MMAQTESPIQVYLEIGQTRTFAAALDWPGWCRSGRDAAAALQALYDYAPRYAGVLQAAHLDFLLPGDASNLVVVEQVEGNATTNFGAPAVTLSGDARPVNPDELRHWQGILEACWQAVDTAVEAAAGRILRKGPRGGGRDLDKVFQHVLDVDVAYLSSLGGKLDPDAGHTPASIRQAILTTLAAVVRGEVPARGPRGGLRWQPRYFVRRLAWHELDHTWEIEDRAA
ncbi:MAG: hypothetical protein VB089_13890 [Anaerolineaceae bacterium]|nr:hypothetical protein [Anaerolineaceae bacterium]